MSERAAFDTAFQAELEELLALRRDVRQFTRDALPPNAIEELVTTTRFSPSVGYSQPWRFVKVDDTARRARVTASFERANADALASYEGERAQLYASLKLAGLRDAPEHLAVFCDEATERGGELGAKTMPQTRAYSAAMAIYTLWLAARARGIGIGWVSILEPADVTAALDVPAEWQFIAYLCIGYPASYERSPELQRAGWEDFDARSTSLTYR
jgi:5,6-dimethylbenzimidazole synthase